MIRDAEDRTPEHRVIDLTWSNEHDARRRLLHTTFCALCRRLSLRNKADAHSYIGILIRRRRPHDYVMTPYRCKYGNGWHVGHNYAAIRVLKRGGR